MFVEQVLLGCLRGALRPNCVWVADGFPSKSGWVLEIVMFHQFARGLGVVIRRQKRPGACGSRGVLGVDFWGLEGVGYKGRVALGSCQLRGLNRQENRGCDERQSHV